MGYVESNLLNGEEIIYRARLHPIVYAPAITFAVLGFLALMMGGNFGREFGLAVGAMMLFFGAIVALEAYIKIATSEFAVTNRRILIKVGWLRRKSLELLLSKVEGIAVDQGIVGRMFDFGTIGVRGIGGSREKFANIAAPLEFRRQVQEILPQ